MNVQSDQKKKYIYLQSRDIRTISQNLACDYGTSSCTKLIHCEFGVWSPGILSCIWNTIMRKTTTNPTHILFKDFTPVKRYTNNIVKLNLWLSELKLYKTYTLRVWGVKSLNPVLYLKQINAKNDHKYKGLIQLIFCSCKTI